MSGTTKIYSTTTSSKRQIFVVVYSDGTQRRAEHLEILGPSTLQYDNSLKKNVIRTNAPVAISFDSDSCQFCGEDKYDGHVHA